MPHWIVTPDATGTWRVSMRLTLGRSCGPESTSQPPALSVTHDDGHWR